MTKTVCISDVTKEYGPVKAVSGASFDLNEGELIALIGHNGAGKTTLMKLMLGLIRPSGGSIEVLGDNPAAGQFGSPSRLPPRERIVRCRPDRTRNSSLLRQIEA